MLEITPLAADQVRQALKMRGKGLGIRLQVTTSECSGFSYQLEFADQWESYELQFVSQDVTIGLSPKALPLMKGSVVDFLPQGEGFIIHNPNVRAECGCGESFSV